MKLFSRTIGEGEPLLILHGLFGSSDNWQTHARVYGSRYKVYLIDLRNHGHSPHEWDCSYDAMCEDLLELVAAESLQHMHLLGHSMGGKVAMRFAQQYPQLVQKLIVADMGMKEYPPHHDAIIKGLYHVDVEHCESRKMAEDRLAEYVKDLSVRQFLMKSLYWKEPGQLAWRFHLEALSANIGQILSALPEQKIMSETLVLRGEKSNYVLDSDLPTLKKWMPHMQYETMKDAGHWLHAENPQLFLDHTLHFLDN